MLREFPAVRPPVAQLATQLCYDTEFEIYRHDQPDPHRPLAGVAMHAKENVVEGGMRYAYIRRFTNYGIHRRFGIDLQGFFALPLDEADLLCDIAKADMTQQDKAQREVRDQMDLDLND